MELEALLLGLEPLTALAIGVGALAVAPIVGAVDAATGKSLQETARSSAKTALVWAFDAMEKTQAAVAEASESFQDLVAEAKSERGHRGSNNGVEDKAPREVTIG